jgi:hypothetical protein
MQRSAPSYLHVANLGDSANLPVGGTATNPDSRNTTDAASYANTSWTPPASGLLLVAALCSFVGGANTPTADHNGVALTQVATVAFGTDWRLTLFAADCAALSTGVTTFDFAGQVQRNGDFMFAHVPDADLTAGVAGAIIQSPTSSGTGTSGSVALAAPGNDWNRTFATFAHFASEQEDARSGWWRVDHWISTGPLRAMHTAWREEMFDPAASASWATSAAWGGIAIELKAKLPLTGTLYQQAVDATLTALAALTLMTGAVRNVAATFTAAILRTTSKVTATAATFAAAVAKFTTTGARAVASTFTAAVAKQARTTRAIGSTLTTAVARQTGKLVAVSLTAGVAVARRAGKLVAAGLTGGMALVRQTAATKALGMTGTVALARQARRIVAAGLTGAPVVLKRAGRMLAAGLTATPAVARRTARTLALGMTAAATAVGNFVAGGGTLFFQAANASMTTSLAVVRDTRKAIAGALTAAPDIAKRTARTVAVGLAAAASVVVTTGPQVFHKAIDVSLSLAPSLVAAFIRAPLAVIKRKWRETLFRGSRKGIRLGAPEPRHGTEPQADTFARWLDDELD